MSNKILLIEDAEESKDLICKALGGDFDVEWVTTFDKAQACLTKSKYSLVLLDVGLPDGDGFHFYSLLKNSGSLKTMPVIFLTGRDSVSDKVLGISLGADDYIVKPFQPLELKARVDLRIRKANDQQKKSDEVNHENLFVSLREQRAYLKNLDERIDLKLTTLEFKILLLLISHEEQVFSRDQIINQVWGENTHLTDRSIDTHVYALRKKLGTMAHVIQSVYGGGYRFSGHENSRKAA